MEKATLRELNDIKGKRVFIRVDHNVPQDEGGQITDDTRIRESLGTIRYCLDKGARVILCTHLGRPKGKDKTFSLAPVAKALGKLLPYKVIMANDCIGPEVEAQVASLKDGQILLLENIRFYAEETDNDPLFTGRLAGLADVYVNDAFGTAHRAHSSTEGIAHHLPAVAGLLMEKEIDILGKAILNPKRPLVVIIGGKKIADKMPVIDNLLNLANTIIIGGGMTYTFIKAQGGNVGNSIVDDNKIEYCKNVIKSAKERGINLLLTVDTVAADRFSNDANTQIVDIFSIPNGWEGLDIGPKTIAKIKDALKGSGTIIWNGTLGVNEFEKFIVGTREVAKAIGEATKAGAITIVGGGDSAAAVAHLGLTDKFTHISTGGGASLEMLEGKILPGVAALNDRR
jgi:3-phosphoglycerate kinase